VAKEVVNTVVAEKEEITTVVVAEREEAVETAVVIVVAVDSLT